MTLEPVRPEAFREAMSHYPSGVTVVTTTGADGRPSGFTASSFCSVSMDPPLVLVCLATAAWSCPAFRACDRFAVSILAEDQADVALRFATRRPDKFDTDRITVAGGLHTVRDAVAVIECAPYACHEAGDHIIIVGRVCRLAASPVPPAVYADRGFHGLRDASSPAMATVR